MYLLDTNIFIQSYKQYYCMDICEGFWEFIEKDKEIHTIKKVFDEIVGKNNKKNDDELQDWMKKLIDKKSNFLINEKEIIETEYYIEVTEGIEKHKIERMDKNPGKKARKNLRTKIETFQNGADYLLIALAKQKGYCIVTAEKKRKYNKNS